MPSAHDSMDVCNLGSLGCSIDLKKLSECKDAWEIPNSNDDMCLISHDFSIDEIKLNSRLSSNDFNKVRNCFEIIPIAGVVF